MAGVSGIPRAASSEVTVAVARARPSGKQPVDYTTLVASIRELSRDWVPSKIEQAIQVRGSFRCDDTDSLSLRRSALCGVQHLTQVDAFTLVLRIRTLDRDGWLYISRHDTGCRIAVGDPPVRGNTAEAFRCTGQILASLASPLHAVAPLWTHVGSRHASVT